ncbi:MAG TPA: hypothetical protein VFO16_06445, partial [Pseudonocardiaceae bacterium]|nr:hypothetical protein [Pseudonocardiaceae bacterium]
TDVCAVADAGTRTALKALSSGYLPRRDLGAQPEGLTGLNTCSLLDQAALRRVPDLEVSRQRPGFAGWMCTWGDDRALASSPWVMAAVFRGVPVSGLPARIGGRPARVVPGDADDPGSCEVDLVQRGFTGSSGEPRAEQLQVSVSLGARRSTGAACRSAWALAEAAAAKLPPIGPTA